MGAPLLQAHAVVQAAAVAAVLAALGGWLLAAAHPALVGWTDVGRRELRGGWGWVHVLVCVLMFLGANVVLAVVALVVEGEGAFDTATVPLLVTAGAGVGTALPLLALAQVHGFGIGWLGFGEGDYLRSIGFGLVVYVVGALWVFGMAGLWAFGLEAAGAFDQQDVAVLIHDADASALPVIVVCAVFLIPWAEEVLFRGVLFGWLHRVGGPALAVVVSSLAFAGVHGFAAFGPILCLALLLAFARLRTRGILAPTVIHMLHNGIQVALLQLTSL
jgi:membrane protease YdiL (CAAX protease family)